MKTKSISYKKMFKVASCSNIRPELQKLYIKNGFAYATDSYKAIKMHTNYDKDEVGYITPMEAAISETKQKIAKVEVLPTIDNNGDNYPDVDRIIPETFEREFKVNRQYLIDLLEAMQKGDALDNIYVKLVAEPYKPIVFENKNGIGLLMPIRD